MAACEAMQRPWQPEGCTSPGAVRYRWQRQWDSCFHSLVWNALGDERAVVELDTLFAHQPGDGMLPHMGYQREPNAALSLSGVTGVSTITHPPMFGHCLAELDAAGHDVERLVGPATRALDFLLERRPRVDELVVLTHPWESGCHDSLRWDRFCPGG